MAQVFNNSQPNDLLKNSINRMNPPKPLGISAIRQSPVRTTTPTTNIQSQGTASPSARGYGPYGKPAPTSTSPQVQQNQGNNPFQSSSQNSYGNISSWPGGIQSQTQITPTANQGGDGGLYGQIVRNLANVGTDKSTGGVKDIYNLQKSYADKLTGLKGKGLDIGYGTGASNLLQENYNNRLMVEQQGLANTLKIGDQQITGLTNAGGLAAPIQAPYTNQVISPISGQSIQGGEGGGMAGGSLNPLNNIQTYAQQVAEGKMTIDQANSALGNSPAFTGALNSAIRQINPNYNFSQSDALAQQQGTIGPAYEFAQKSLENLKNVLGTLSAGQNTNVPLINKVGQGISNLTGLGSAQVRQFQGAVQEARNAYAQLLASSRGGTPTDYGDQSKAAIPDSPTPNDIEAAIRNLQTLGGAKLNIYGNPGQVQTNPQTSGSGNGWF